MAKIERAKTWKSRKSRTENVEIAKIAHGIRGNRENSGVFREKCLKTPLKIKLSVQKWPFCPLYVCKKYLFCVKKWQSVRFLDEIVVDKVKNSGVFREKCLKTPLNLKKNTLNRGQMRLPAACCDPAAVGVPHNSAAVGVLLPGCQRLVALRLRLNCRRLACDRS